MIVAMEQAVEESKPEPLTAEAKAEQERREEGRVEVFHRTEVRSMGETYAAVVRDLSRWGAMVECAEPLRVRSYIYLVLPGLGSLPGRVTWTREGCFGANLLEPITDYHFERLIRVIPPRPEDA
jgi:hypothetical protein